ncbi:MAG: MFS transporter [Proteobacteria bacterium]|nr:MFS transporter [Pseudomonadota bacterium]
MTKRIYIPLLLSIFSAMLGMGIIAPLLPIYAQNLGATTAAIGLIFASFSISRTFFLPVVARISDTTGMKIMIVFGLILFILTSIGYVFSSKIFHLVLTRSLQGIAAALIIPATLAYVGEVSPARREGAFMGVFNLFFFGGLGAGPFLGGLLNDLFGIDSSFYTMGMLGSIGLLLTLIFLPERKPDPANRKHLSSWSMFREPAIRGIFLFRFLYSVTVGLLWSFLPIFAHNFLGLNSSRIGVLVSLNVLVATVLQAPCGFLADRLSKKGLVAIGGGMGAIGFSLIPLSKRFVEIFGISLLLGVSGGIAMPALMALAVEAGKRTEGMGRLMSFFVMAHSLGMIVGPLMAGLIGEVASVSTVFFIGALIGVVGVAALALSQDPRGEKALPA